MKTKFIFLILVFLLSLVFSFNVYADEVCCQRDINNNFCSYVGEEQCAPGSLKVATSCDQTSFCKAGVCSGIDGFCYDNYPKALCDSNNGTFHNVQDSSEVAECNLGCCLI